MHIAKEYYDPAKDQWGPNFELFERAVGAHVDRVNNLYFAFLFVLRAAVKANDLFQKYPVDRHNSTEDQTVKKLLYQLATAKLLSQHDGVEIPVGTRLQTQGANPKEVLIASGDVTFLAATAPDECRNGFDESVLFQVIFVSDTF